MNVVNFVNKSINPDPVYAHDMDSGFDLRANIIDMFHFIVNDIPTIFLPPMERILVSTGLFFQLPFGYEMQVRSRSGLALKHGIMVLNSPGTVDNMYTNEVKIILMNLSNTQFEIRQGDRIAQAVIAKVSSNNDISLIKTSYIDDNIGRNKGGFGSTGVK